MAKELTKKSPLGPIANLLYYRPLESPKRYPLELTKSLHVCLWDTEGRYKWTIAYWQKDKEGYDLQFVGDRPLDKRVNWSHFRKIIVQGQKIADDRFAKEESDENQSE